MIRLSSSLANIIDAKVQVGWSYDKDRFCALILIDPVVVEVPYEGKLYTFLTDPTQNKQYEMLRNKALVTQLVKCTTYAILLTNGEKGEAYAGFHVDVPIPTGVPVTAGGGTKVGWKTDCVNGAWSTGVYEAGVHKYTPLCTLRNIRAKEWAKIRGVSRRLAPQGVRMLDYNPPWGELNADGSELRDEDENEESGDDIGDVGN